MSGKISNVDLLNIQYLVDRQNRRSNLGPLYKFLTKGDEKGGLNNDKSNC